MGYVHIGETFSVRKNPFVMLRLCRKVLLSVFLISKERKTFTVETLEKVHWTSKKADETLAIDRSPFIKYIWIT